MAISKMLWNDMTDDLDDIRSDVSDAIARYGANDDPVSRSFVDALESVDSMLADADADLFRAEVER